MDGRVALVVAQNRERRLLPWVIMLSDARRQPLVRRTLNNLAAEGGPAIRQVLDPGSHGFAVPGVEVLAV